jgi:hypothetical protein
MRTSIICFLLCCFSTVFCQSDILVVRKHNQNIAQYYAGRNITFFTEGMEVVRGYVKNISHDTIYMNQYETRMAITMFGTYQLDTIAVYHVKYNYHEIIAFPKEESFSFIKDGSLFMIAGAGYAALNLINAATQKNQMVGGTDNIIKLSAAAVVFGVGFLLKKMNKNYMPIGHKYKILYLSMKQNKEIEPRIIAH